MPGGGWAVGWGPGGDRAVDGVPDLSAPTRRMNRFALDRHLPRDRALGLADLLIDPTQRAPSPIGLVLVVDDLVAVLVRVTGRPG